MTRITRGGRFALSMTAAAIALSATLAACSGHGSASNSVLPTTQNQSIHHDVTVTNIYGGGSTLASLLYRQEMDYYGVAMPPDPQGASNGLPVNKSFQYYYGGIGSGGGRGSFLAQSPSTITPQSTPIYCPNGVTTCWPYPSWEYTGSDAIFSSAEIGCYDSGCASEDGYTNIAAALPVRGQYIQVPSVSTDITIPYNPSGQTVGSSGLNLDRNVYCGIWEGAITSWADPGITADNGGHQVSTQSITRVVRSDSSGTTALLTNHLLTVCVGLANPAYDWTGGTGGTVTWPNNTGNVLAESGSSGVVTGVGSTSGAIGYVGPSFVAPIVSGGLPTSNLQDQYQVTNNKLKFVAPSVTTTLNAFKGINPPTNTDPYDLGYNNPDPTQQSAYPIVGYTWIEAYQCYSTTNDATGVADFIKWYSMGGATGTTAADIIEEAQGLAPMSSKWKTAVHAIATHVVKGPVSGICTI
jgi:phosphate transport system substrate-binding protein